MKKRILFLSKGDSASSTRYRALQYFPSFVASGFSPNHLTISGGILPFIVALKNVRKAHTVVLIRKTFPYPLFWLLRKCSKRLIYDFDDAIFCNTDGSFSTTRMNRFINTVKQSDLVFAGNHYLANEALKHNSHTNYIPTSLEVEKYNQIGSDIHAKNQFTLVWIGSKSTRKYIQGILPAIESAAESVPNLALKIIADFSLDSKKVTIQNVDWSEETEAIALSQADVGIAPLPEDDWTKGKCALKVLQYMATGLPVISSATSANGYIVDHLKNGFIANSKDEWAEMIRVAYQHQNKLKEMGQSGRERVAKEFDIAIIYKKINQLINT